MNNLMQILALLTTSLDTNCNANYKRNCMIYIYNKKSSCIGYYYQVVRSCLPTEAIVIARSIQRTGLAACYHSPQQIVCTLITL